MNLSAPFISRPIATTLLSIGMALAGILSFNSLPISSLPDIEFPAILIQANISGSSPENMASSVTTPLELSLSRIAAVDNMTSSSTFGKSTIIMQFDLNRDINGAARDVQAALNAAAGNLPSTMTSPPTYLKVNPADSPILVYSLTSDTHNIASLYNIASTTLQQKLLKIEGVGQILVVGSSLPAVRVSFDIDKMNQLNLSLSTVINHIKQNNVNMAKGEIDNDKNSYSIATNDQIFSTDDYGNIIIRSNNNEVIKLKDIATIKESVQNTNNSGIVNGKPSILMVLFKSSSANVIATNLRVRDAFNNLKSDIPAGIYSNIVLDRTTTIFASLLEVEKALIGAMIFVIIVVYLFLGSFRSMLIPGVAMTLSLLGTFGVIWCLGFSLNILSMMALAISTGFIVDDAIVVLENISRHIESGMKPKEASLKGAAEIGFTVTSISLALIVVFIPILLMGGIVGRLFREFAVTLSVAIMISLLLSLTLTPMMCATMLKSNPNNGLKIIDKLKDFYHNTLGWVLNHTKLMIGITIITFLLNIYLFAIIPKGFFPAQDTGRIVCNLVADQNTSFKALNNQFTGYINMIKEDPAVENVIGFISSSSVYTATIYIILKKLELRDSPSEEVISRLRKRFEKISGTTLYMQIAQDLVIGARKGNAQYQYTVSGNSIEEVNHYAPLILQEMKKVPGIVDLNSDQESNGLQTYININYDEAARLGITAKHIDDTLYAAFGQYPISIMYKNSNQYYVVTEIADNYAQNPEVLNKIYVPSVKNNILVPLSSFSSIQETSSILAINHQSLAPSATLSFNLQPGAVLGDVVDEVNFMLSKLSLPITIEASFKGTAQAFQDMISSEIILIITSIFAIYLILGMLYESLIHPFTIISTLPSAGVGALLALLITNTTLTIVAMIGVILLIGIVAKNAIMMIDFVLTMKRHDPNMDPKEAIHKAAVLRFRPIMMTTMAALLGAVPMAIGTGSGSEMYRPLGIAIIGGLIVSQILTLYTTPVVYLCLEKFKSK